MNGGGGGSGGGGVWSTSCRLSQSHEEQEGLGSHLGTRETSFTRATSFTRRTFGTSRPGSTTFTSRTLNEQKPKTHQGHSLGLITTGWHPHPLHAGEGSGL